MQIHKSSAHSQQIEKGLLLKGNKEEREGGWTNQVSEEQALPESELEYIYRFMELESTILMYMCACYICTYAHLKGIYQIYQNNSRVKLFCFKPTYLHLFCVNCTHSAYILKNSVFLFTIIQLASCQGRAKFLLCNDRISKWEREKRLLSRWRA